MTLSFGFPRYDAVLAPISDAIRQARTNGVIIFAAAGNEGGNAGVFWPASMHATGDVIRVNASDGRGAPSNTNPGPGICTLGQGVPSCEPDTRSGTDGESKVVHRSGSSFATPIAAAIAAIVLGVMDGVNEEDYPEYLVTLRPRLRTWLGMATVLCETCVQQGGNKGLGYFYITPWHFLGAAEETQVHAILRILTNVTP